MKAFVKVLWVDLALFLAAIAVWADEEARIAYAPSIGLRGSFDYSLLVQYFSLTGGTTDLRSPPTLSWLQVIAVALVALNAFYFVKRSTRGTAAPAQAPAPPA